MKKIYSIAIAFMLGAASMTAQTNNDVRFVTIDADVNKTGDVADGATITVTTVEGDELSGEYISTGLGVENTTDSGKRVQIDYEIQSLDNGAMQCCFSACKANYAVGTYYTPILSSSGNRINLPVVKKNTVQSLAGEWFFTEEGKATVKFTIKIGKENTSKTDAEGTVYDVVDGPSVTVNFVKLANGIGSAAADETSSSKWYDMSGREVKSPANGIYVKKTTLADGTVSAKKVIINK